MRRIPTALSLLLTVAIAGCALTPTLESYRPKNADETAIVSTLLKIPYGMKDKALDVLLLPYAGDVYVGNFNKYLGAAGPFAPLTISRAELRSLYTELFRSSKSLSMDVKNFRLNVTGERAVAFARTELLLTGEGGKPQEKERLYINDVTWRMRRTAAGWKIVEEIWD
jgi:hypothetical protein